MQKGNFTNCGKEEKRLGQRVEARDCTTNPVNLRALASKGEANKWKDHQPDCTRVVGRSRGHMPVAPTCK